MINFYGQLEFVVCIPSYIVLYSFTILKLLSKTEFVDIQSKLKVLFVKKK